MNKLLSRPISILAVLSMVFSACQKNPISRLLGHSSDSSSHVSSSGGGEGDSIPPDSIPPIQDDPCAGKAEGHLSRTAGPLDLPVEVEFKISSISTDGYKCPEEKAQSDENGYFKVRLAGESGEATLEIYDQQFRIFYKEAIPGPADLGTTEICLLCA